MKDAEEEWRETEKALNEVEKRVRVGVRSENSGHVLSVLGAMAKLSYRLARTSDESTRRILRLTWGVFWLTVAVLVVAAIQVVIMVIERMDKTP